MGISRELGSTAPARILGRKLRSSSTPHSSCQWSHPFRSRSHRICTGIRKMRQFKLSRQLCLHDYTKGGSGVCSLSKNSDRRICPSCVISRRTICAHCSGWGMKEEQAIGKMMQALLTIVILVGEELVSAMHTHTTIRKIQRQRDMPIAGIAGN